MHDILNELVSYYLYKENLLMHACMCHIYCSVYPMSLILVDKILKLACLEMYVESLHPIPLFLADKICLYHSFNNIIYGTHTLH